MAEPMNRLHAALAARYVIEREVGRGGMATVYLAHDVKHRRPVAIKVLHADLAASVGAERFLREIHTAARLQHPHILPLHDSGDVNGTLFYVMPYVEGESLRNRLDREHQLPIDEALRITREVADALTYAHAHNVVHRDIKPGNILLSGDRATGDSEGAGHALVMDFGIATAVSSVGGESLTQAGLAVGTPSYMSPEQAIAEDTVDGRADTYALGCVLYEMLTGHPPFPGSTSREILTRHSLDPVPSLRATRADVPASVDRAVAVALSKSPDDRYATAAAFSSALTARVAPSLSGRPSRRRLAYVAAAVALLVAGYGLVRSARARQAAMGTIADAAQSIAILPFTNVGGDSANEPFSDGMADELTTALGKVDGLVVTARTSAFNLKRQGLDPREIGRQLHVRYVVEGRVRRSTDRRRVGVDLIDVASGREVWSDNFEHNALNRDEFTVQDSITRSIVRQLLPHISRAALASSARHATESPEAHALYLQGRYFFEKKDSASFAKAQEYFRRAIQRDSLYAVAYAGLADAYSQQATWGFARLANNFSKAKEYASRALALDSTLAEVHVSLGFIALFYDWDWMAANREFATALRLNERYAPAHLFHAWLFVATDSTSGSITEGRRAVELDPFSPLNNARLVGFLFYGRRYAEALEQGRKTFERDSSVSTLRQELARVYVELGRCADALAVLQRSVDQPVAGLGGIRGYTYAKCGQRAQAVAELEHLRAQARNGRYISAYVRAVIHAGLGQRDLAIAELEDAYVERNWAMFLLKLEPAFVSLHSDPRFMALVRRVGLVT